MSESTVKKGLVRIERFLGCAQSAVVILNMHDVGLISCSYVHTWMLWHYFIGLSKIKSVDSAQPRNCSIPSPR